MPLYVIEREFAEELELTSDDVRLIDEINADEGVRWLFSFLSADRRHTYCLYEAPSPEAIRAAAQRANVPADAIVEVERARVAGARAAPARMGRRAGRAADALTLRRRHYRPVLGDRPCTTPTNPNSQPTSRPIGSALGRGNRRGDCCRRREYVEEPSRISVPGARALALAPTEPTGPPEAFLIDREFAHLHPAPDHSLHGRDAAARDGDRGGRRRLGGAASSRVARPHHSYRSDAVRPPGREQSLEVIEGLPARLDTRSPRPT